jgi:hypothetical protein
MWSACLSWSWRWLFQYTTLCREGILRAYRKSFGRSGVRVTFRTKLLCVRSVSQINRQFSKPINCKHTPTHCNCCKWAPLVRNFSSSLKLERRLQSCVQGVELILLAILIKFAPVSTRHCPIFLCLVTALRSQVYLCCMNIFICDFSRRQSLFLCACVPYPSIHFNVQQSRDISAECLLRLQGLRIAVGRHITYFFLWIPFYLQAVQIL